MSPVLERARALDRYAKGRGDPLGVVPEDVERAVRRVVLAALRELPKAVDVDELAAAIEARRLGRARKAWGEFEAVGLERALATAVARAAAAEARRLGVGKAREDEVVVRLLFDVDNPQVASWARLHAAKLVVELGRRARDTLSALVRRVFREGGHPRDLARRIREVVGLHERWARAVLNLRLRLEAEGVARSQVERAVARYYQRLLRARALNIARTEVLRAANEGKLLAWREAAKAGLLPNARKEWVATAGACPICAPVDGTTVGLDEFFSTSAGNLDGPPAHPSCVVVGTLVGGPPAVGATRRWYEGDAVFVRTALGHELTVTPNHPVLTPEGWIAAGSLHEGDRVVGRALVEGETAAVDPHHEQVPSPVEKVVRALAEASGMATVQVPAAPEQFHGDGIGSEVDVVRADRLLRNGREPASAQEARQSILGGRGGYALSGDRATLELLAGSDPAASGHVGGRDVRVALLDRPAGLLDPVGLRDSSARHSLLPQDAPDDVTSDAVLMGQSLLRHAGEVVADELIEVRRVPLLGHVFNLQTVGGWYSAGGIIVHNCRCTSVLIVGANRGAA